MTLEFETLLEKRKLRSSRDEFPLISFYEKIKRTRLLSDFAETKRGTGALKLKSEARRQFIISLVTALEVYLGDLTIELIDKAQIKYGKRIIESASKKYDIIEIREILRNKITMGELICDQINFQNLEKIFGFLKNLFGTDMSKLLEKNKFIYTNQRGNPFTIFLRRGFNKNLQRVIKMRHTFTHDIRFSDTPSLVDLKKCEVLIKRFAVCIDVKADQFRKVESSRIIKK